MVRIIGIVAGIVWIVAGTVWIVAGTVWIVAGIVWIVNIVSYTIYHLVLSLVVVEHSWLDIFARLLTDVLPRYSEGIVWILLVWRAIVTPTVILVCVSPLVWLNVRISLPKSVRTIRLDSTYSKLYFACALAFIENLDKF